jgi:site-specific DNA-methyltransferase (adenine-specific)
MNKQSIIPTYDAPIVLCLGDCLEVMTAIPDGSIDMVLCDLPYGTTQNKWDTVIDLPSLWAQYRRIVKENGAIVLTAQTPFDKALGVSNLPMLRYEWIWEKPQGTGHLNAKRAPMKNHENVLVFYQKPPIYNPQMREGKPYTCKSGRGSSNYGEQVSVVTENTGERYPLTVLKFNPDTDKLHPTQKPVSLFEYMVKTYTQPGDIVLDNCMGSGTGAIACVNSGRSFIGIDNSVEYVEMAAKRFSDHAGVEPRLIRWE